KGDKTLIIDAKFYSENMSVRFEGGKPKHLSDNLYQLFPYLENWSKKEEEVIAGMLLDAKPEAKNQANKQYKINRNQTYIESLDVDQDFTKIVNDLLLYAQTFLE